MQVRVLGDLEVALDGAVVDLGGPKPRGLLALLVAAEGRPVPVENLIDQIWGEEPPLRVEGSLQSYVARLRKVLEPARDARTPAARLRTHAGSYSLDVAADDVDARRFTASLREARTRLGSDPDAAARLLTEALALWRGDAYAGATSPSLRAEATRLGELRLGAVEDLWALRVRQGHHTEAVAELEQLVAQHPLREQLWALLVQALYRAHRQGDALAALRRAREHLRDELGVDPGAELRQLEEQVLRQDPVLEAEQVRTAGPEHAPPPAAPVTVVPAGRALHGREDALDLAAAALADARAGRGRTVVVTGEAGIGKTRFGEALVARAEAAGFRTGRGGWEAEACPPLWGWTRATGQLLGQGDLLEPGGEVTDAASASFRQADALLTVLRAGPPSLLVLDDVHWADTESLRLLRRVAAGLADAPVVLVVALRATPSEIGEPVADLLAALARLDPVRLPLDGLDAPAIADWVREHTGKDVPADVAVALADRTDGNPFYVTELVRLLVSEGALSSVDSRAWRSVPGGVRDVVRQRLAQLPTPADRVVSTAAVIGRAFDVLVIERATAIDGSAVDTAMESALVLGLVEDRAPGRYRFTHALVRDAIYEALPAPARARAHAEVAAALERHYAGSLVDHHAELAEHYRLAGPVHARSGWVHARHAAQGAAERSAHDQALALYADAGALQELDPLVTPDERESVLLGQAAALAKLGRPLDAWPLIARAATSALDRDDVPGAAAALLAITEGHVWGWRNYSEYDDEAIALWERVLARLPATATQTKAHLQAALAVELLYRPGAAERAVGLADEALAAARRSGARDADRYQVLRLVNQALLRPDLLHRRLPIYDELVELASALGDASGLAAALTGRASDRVELARLADARSDLVRAHELARSHHLSQNLMVSGWCLAMDQQIEGDFAGAEAAIRDLEAFQATLAMAGEGIGLCQLATLRFVQGRLGELEEALRAAASSFPLFRELHALALVHAGRTQEARAVTGGWAEQSTVPWDYLWVGFTIFRAHLWMAFGDAEAVADLRRQLTPFADRLAVGSLAVSFHGSVELTLGELALAAGDRGAARRHLERARQTHEALGLGVWVDRTDEVLGRLEPALPS